MEDDNSNRDDTNDDDDKEEGEDLLAGSETAVLSPSSSRQGVDALHETRKHRKSYSSNLKEFHQYGLSRTLEDSLNDGPS
jgi:hypothetical protein